MTRGSQQSPRDGCDDPLFLLTAPVAVLSVAASTWQAGVVIQKGAWATERGNEAIGYVWGYERDRPSTLMGRLR